MLHAFELYGQWLRRDLSQRFGGSAFGRLWLVLQPLSLIIVITWVFNGIFRTKWPGGDGSAIDYGLKVLVGMGIHMWAADILNRSCVAISGHAYIVTKVRFPLAMIPAVAWGVATVQLLLTLGLVIAFAVPLGAAEFHQAAAAVVLLPLMLLPAGVLLAGLGWWCAGVGAYLKDLGNFMPAVTSLLMFLMPVFYPAEMVPPQFAWWVQANPLAFAIEACRSWLFAGELPSLAVWAAHLAGSLVVLLMGWWTFERVKPGFADVL